MATRDFNILTKDGRTLQLREAGQPDGIPIIVHHGTPGSRLLYHTWIEDAHAKGIRLIGFDRAGYGGSTANTGRNVAAVAEDIADIASHLNIEKLAVWGASGGGPHTLACAALLPDLVAAAGVIASVAPYEAAGLDWFAGMGDDNLEEFGAALDGRDTLEKYLAAQSAGLLGAEPLMVVEALQSLLSPVDVAVLNEENATFLLDSFKGGIKHSSEGWIDDDLAFTLPWGFDLAQIKIPVLLLHGQQDRFVPLSHGRWLAERIPDVEAQFSADEGHLTLAISKIPEVHAWLLNKWSN